MYLLAYPYPKTAYEISHEIYGRDDDDVRKKLKKLHELGYVKKIKKEDGRGYKWLAKVEPLIEKIRIIKQKENIQITKLDEYILKKQLGNRIIRQSVEKKTPDNIKEETINAIDFILTIFETDLMTKEFTFPEHPEINSIEEYEELVAKRKRPHEDIPQLVKEEHKDDPDFDFKKEMQIFEGMWYLTTTPQRILDKCKRISTFGKRFYELKWSHQAVNRANTRSALIKQKIMLESKKMIDDIERNYKKIHNKKARKLIDKQKYKKIYDINWMIEGIYNL